MGNVRVLDVGFVSRVVHNQDVVCQCIVYPFLQLVFRQGCSRRVVRVTEVEYVHPAGRQFGREVVCFRAGDVNNIAPFAVFQYSGASAHDVGVYVNGVDRVEYPDTVVVAENIADISAIAFGTVADEDLSRLQEYAAAGIIILDDCVDQEAVSLFGAVTVEILCRSQIIHCLMHGFDDGRCQGLCYITDSHADYFVFRVCHFETVYLFRDVGKQVTALQFQEMFINQCHIRSIVLCCCLVGVVGPLFCFLCYFSIIPSNTVTAPPVI